MLSFSKNNRSAIGEGIYLLYFAIMIGARALGLYEGMTVYNVSLVAGMLLFGCKMIVTKHTIKEYALAAFFLLIAGIVYLHTGEKGLLVCFTMLLGMKEVSVQKVIKTGIIVAGVIILLKIFTGAFALTSEVYYPQEREGIGMMFRHALGYAHPNTLHMNVLMLTMLVLYYVTSGLVKDKSRDSYIKLILCSGLMFFFNLYVFQYSGSRTGILAGTVFIVINFWFFLRSKPGIFEKCVCYLAFPAVCFIAIVVPFILPEKIFDFIDKTIFTTRLTIARYFWAHNSVSLWGIRLVNEDEYYSSYGLDMAQLYLFLQLGIIAFIVMAALTMWFVYYCLKKNRLQELAVLLGMLCLGIWEPLLYNLGYKNFVYVFMGVAIYEALGDVKEDYCLFTRDNWINRIQAITVMKGIAFGVLSGVFAMMIFLLATARPSAFYGSRELDESGRSLGMQGEYYTQEEILSFEAAGDIVVGYTDSSMPMYRYDEVIALGEYHKRAMSVAVFVGIPVSAIGMALLHRKKPL